MKRISICVFATQLGMLFASHAQTLDPTDAQLAVPPAVHASVFEGRNDERDASTPNAVWRRANDAARDGTNVETPAMPMPASDSHEHAPHHHHGE